MPKTKINDISPLIMAINVNSLDDAKAAIAGGCDVNGTMYDETPLICAIRNGRPELVKLFLEHGADPRHRDCNTPWTPFMLASIQVHLPARKHRPARVAKGSREIVRIFHAAGVNDPEADGIYGRVEKESTLLKSAKARGARADTLVLEADGVVIEYPLRLKRDPLGRIIPSITLLELARAYGLNHLEEYLMTEKVKSKAKTATQPRRSC
jgi:hypothetical protein